MKGITVFFFLFIYLQSNILKDLDSGTSTFIGGQVNTINLKASMSSLIFKAEMTPVLLTIQDYGEESQWKMYVGSLWSAL